MLVSPQLKILGQILTPSWLSGLVAVVIGLAIVIGAAATLHYNGSSIQLLRQIQDSKPHAVQENYDVVDDHLSANQLISDIPLLILWGGVGLLVYSLIMKIIETFSSAVNFKRKLQYVHTDRHQLVNQTFLRLAIRILVFVAWLLYIRFTIHVLVPYVIALAYAGSGGLGLFESGGYLLGAAVLMILGIHLHTVMLRLMLLKPRAFGQIN